MLQRPDRERAAGLPSVMAQRDSRPRSAIGFTVKSGWAAVVLLEGPLPSPRVVDSRRIELSDPAVPESRQPYHADFGTPRAAGPELSRLLRTVHRMGTRSVTAVIRHYAAVGHEVVGAGVVVGSLIDPERIGNAHIRIHAREGQLFRQVVEDAAAAGGVRCSVWRQRDLYGVAADMLKRSEPSLVAAATSLGKAVAGGWRTEQKAAAVAAWLMLADSFRGARPRRRVGEKPDVA